MHSTFLFHIFNKFQIVVELIKHDFHQYKSFRGDIIDLSHSRYDLFILINSIDKKFNLMCKNFSFRIFVL